MQTNISEDEIRAQGGIIYDPAKWGKDGSDTNNFIDAAKLSDQIIDIYTYMLQDSTKLLRKQMNNDAFEDHMTAIYKEFSNAYYALFKKIISGEDIGPLMMMLREIDKCNNGKSSTHDAEKNVGKSLKNKYLPNLENNNKAAKKNKRG